MSNMFAYLAFFLYLCNRFCIKRKMVRPKHIYIVVLLLLSSMPFVCAQNGTSSPFSRYGYGDLNENVPGAYRALGGVGIGMRNNKVINPSQPASYTSCDSLTFMFDIAASGMWDQYKDASGVQNKGNGNLEYVTIQVPLWKQWIAASVGVLPYGSVGYAFSLSDSINRDYHYTTTYQGTGGFTQVYGGLSFNVLNWFAAGANVYYMFGTMTNARSLTFTEGLKSTSQYQSITISDVRFRYGAQLFHKFEHSSFCVGAIFENKSDLKGTRLYYESITADTIANDSSLMSDMPMTWGVGASYSYDGRFTLGVDYAMYCWADARMLGLKNQYRNRGKLSVGFEYVHNPLGRRYVDHMPWRVGFSIADAYSLAVPGKDITVTVGTAFPLHNVGTVINTSLEYGHRGKADVLSENYIRFVLSASIAENWFFKRKL